MGEALDQAEVPYMTRVVMTGHVAVSEAPDIARRLIRRDWTS